MSASFDSTLALLAVRWRRLGAAGRAARSGPFPVDMIGAGERVTNTGPPSVALLAFAAAQTGLLLAAERAVNRLLARRRCWRLVTWLNPKVMTIYLRQRDPVVIVAVSLHPTGLMPQASIGGAHWRALRLAWFAVLTFVLVPLVAVVTWAERPLGLLPSGLGRLGPWSPALLAAAITAVTRLVISGFVPGGSVPWPVLAA
jgi:hypothetical protein